MAQFGNITFNNEGNQGRMVGGIVTGGTINQGDTHTGSTITNTTHHNQGNSGQIVSGNVQGNVTKGDNYTITHGVGAEELRLIEERHKKEIEAYKQFSNVEAKGILDISVVHADKASVKENREEIYRNFSAPKGVVLIINNVNFAVQELGDRLGSDMDETNLTNLWQGIGYEVTSKRNLSAKEIIMAIREFARHEKHRQADSAVVIVLTHGANGSFYGCDGKQASIAEFISELNASNCPALAGKPKLFIFQACRGEVGDKGYDIDNPEDRMESDGGIDVLKKVFSASVKRDEHAIQEIRGRIPSYADMIIAYAVTPGYVSFRQTVSGSWFIQSLCEVFQEHAKDKDICWLLTRVNRRVSGRKPTNAPQDDNIHECKQMPDWHSRLVHTFYLFPGYSGN